MKFPLHQSQTIAPPLEYDRLGSLRRFATTTTLLTIVGHAYLGFEMSYAVPLVAVVTAYIVQTLLEWARSRQEHDTPLYRGGVKQWINFLLPAHIIGLTCAAFLYPGQQLWPTVFATTLAVGSKAVFRVRSNGYSRHFLNPANFGVLWTLVLLPSVGIFLPYQFHSAMGTLGDVLLPLILALLGLFINFRYTNRLPLVVAWLAAFVVQAVARSILLEEQLLAMLAPPTGTAAILFTFFMISDPGTTPAPWRRQMIFGSAIGLAYGLFMALHITYAVFWALFSVCLARGLMIGVSEARRLRLAPTMAPIAFNSAKDPNISRAA